MAEKRTAYEFVSHYLGMGLDPASIEKSKLGKKNTLYIQLVVRETALELLKRGGLARKKNDDIKVTNLIPPQVFDRYLAALDYCKQCKDIDPGLIMTVRLGETDVRIMSKTESENDWRTEVLPDLPSFNNNIFWEGLISTKIRPNIEEFSPMKGALPSETKTWNRL